jgi:transposase-like protein
MARIKYDTSMAQSVRVMLKQTKTVADGAKTLGVSTRQLKAWIHRYPELTRYLPVGHWAVKLRAEGPGKQLKHRYPEHAVIDGPTELTIEDLQLGVDSPINDKLKMATTIYDPTFNDIIKTAASLGATHYQIAAIFGVRRSQLDGWLFRYPSFMKAWRDGSDHFNTTVVEDALKRRAVGYMFTEVKRERVFLDATETDKEGKERKVKIPGEKVTTTEKHIPPDTFAATYWLWNRSDRWRKNEGDDTAHPDASGLDLSKLDLSGLNDTELELFRRLIVKAIEAEKTTGSGRGGEEPPESSGEEPTPSRFH